MRIGIDGACLANRRGFGRFSREVVSALGRAGSTHEFVLFLDGPSADAVHVPEGFATVRVAMHEAPSQAASARGRRRLTDMLAMSRAIARSGVDLMYFPATYSFVPVWGVRRVVVTMHDTLPFTHPELVFPTARGRLAWTLKERLALAQADRIVTVSEASRRDLLTRFRLAPGRLTVIVEGVEPVFREAGTDDASVLERHGLDPTRRFLLYVGGLSPHKNLLRLIDAFADLNDPEVSLVLVGDTKDVFHTHVPELGARIRERGLQSRVRFTGFLPDAELAAVYRRAYALVQPSLLEGFGLPAAEAMACGTPVIHSRTGSLPEVVGPAGLSFEPTDAGSIRQAMAEMLRHPERRTTLSRVARERSQQFVWEASARQLLACFEAAAD